MRYNTVYHGDAVEVMLEWPAGCVDCCVTSPPYWGLRDYGVAGQLGLEKTPEEYIEKMVAVFREVRRVLKDEGTCWVNMGDSYWGGKGQSGQGSPEYQAARQDESLNKPHHQIAGQKQTRPSDGTHSIYKPKDLCMMPARLAISLQADGWYLRSDIIWHKPNPMPESCTDRPTKSHEHIFLLTKRPKYWYDADAIREESTYGENRGTFLGGTERVNKANICSGGHSPSDKGETRSQTGSRNKRDVWTVATAPYAEAHFATFPPKLIEPCILAGCPEWVCKMCSKARVRVTEPTMSIDRADVYAGKHADGDPQGNQKRLQTLVKAGREAGLPHDNTTIPKNTTGWTDCECGAGFDGGSVFDPFMGSGTVAEVAYNNNRQYVGIELNPEYIRLIDERMEKVQSQFALFED